MYCVYKHTSPSNKVYIGITSNNPLKRCANGKRKTAGNYKWKYVNNNIETKIIS